MNPFSIRVAIDVGSNVEMSDLAKTHFQKASVIA